MADLGWLLYVVFAGLLAFFWTKVRGSCFDDLLDRAAREHHRVHGVLAKHPRGGAWAEYKSWMGDKV
ncbi:MAG: hypothetical protein OEL78_00445 [Hyphomicrobiales bacterium]|nr:hypothetical protein [Hyphomicrobiales bacterium]